MFIFLFVQLVNSNEETTQVNEQQDDDYHYKPDLSDDQIKKLEEEKRLRELEKQRKEQEELRRIQDENKQPDFLEKIKENDKSANFNMEKFYMEKIMSEYMKKYQQEQLEKRRQKAKSDLNHPMLSVITLIVFFGLGTIIGLIIMFVRSKKFQKSTYKSDKRSNSSTGTTSNSKNNNNSNKKPSYDKVEQNDQII